MTLRDDGWAKVLAGDTSHRRDAPGGRVTRASSRDSARSIDTTERQRAHLTREVQP